jgi:hypothetical protein
MPRHIALLATLAGIACCPPAHAQQVQGGSIGFVLDPAVAAVRPLGGVPGAGMIGDPVELGAGIVSLAVSPKQDYYIAVTAAGSALYWQRATGTVQPLPNLPAGASQVVLSPEGGSALFVFPATSQIRVMTGLPGAPVPGMSGSLTDLLNPANLFAVSDDGAQALVSESSVAGNPSPSVAVFTANGVPGLIALAGPATAIAFLSNSHDALLSSALESVLIRNAAAQTSRIALNPAVNGSIGAVASSDGSTGYFVNAGGMVSSLPLASALSQPGSFNCQCAPTGIYRTAATGVYRLNEISSGPISLFDASSSQPRSLVIPPLAVPVNQ